MNRIKFKQFLTILLISVVGGLGFQIAEAQTKKKKIKYYTVPAGQTLRVRIESSISSKTAQVGNTFRTTTIDPVYSSGGIELIPAGSTVIGHVTGVQKAAKNGKTGSIDVNFTSVVLPNKRRAAISGFLTSLDEDGTKSDNEGTVSANKTKRRNLKFIGGGGVGAAVGAGVGAVGGLITKKLVKGDEAEVKQGTQFGVYLGRAISLPR